MQKGIAKFICLLTAAVTMMHTGMTAFAVTLPDGTVDGLPSALTVMDDSGNAVASDGEYFFEVQDMQPNTDYTKNIQIMNLQDDKAYHIYFYAEPVSHGGEIDLNGDCEAVFTLDGEEVFRGDVNGNPEGGGTKLSDDPIDLGSYTPGDTRTLTCTITWKGESADLVVNYGKRLVSKDGTVVLEEGENTDNYIDGNVYFRWVFCAAVDTDYKPPKTGVLGTSGTIFLALAGGCVFLIILFLILLRRKHGGRRLAQAAASGTGGVLTAGDAHDGRQIAEAQAAATDTGSVLSDETAHGVRQTMKAETEESDA